MTIEGVDYSTSRPSPGALYAAGKRFVVRYGGPGRSDKQLTLSEARALTAAGLSIVANAEGSSGGLLGGRSVGVSWAASADTHFTLCGMPGGRPIYLSVDWDVQSSEWPTVADALRGAASVIGVERVGVYGGRNAVTWARRDGVAHWFWQTYAWSGGAWAAGNHIEQYLNAVTVAGGDCDLDRTRVADYGQWGQPVPTPLPSPPATTPTAYQEEEMILTCTDGSGADRSVNGVAVPALGRVLATPNGPWSLSGSNVGGFDSTFWKNTPQMTWADIKALCVQLVPVAPTGVTPVQVQIDAAPVAAAIVADPGLADLIYNKSFQAAQDAENR